MSVDATHFGGDDRFVADYMRDEFLAGISVARLRFLMRTSILEDLAGKICDDVLERTGSGRVLRELARSKLPLEPLDHADGTYRYHPLFKQTLGLGAPSPGAGARIQAPSPRQRLVRGA